MFTGKLYKEKPRRSIELLEKTNAMLTKKSAFFYTLLCIAGVTLVAFLFFILPPKQDLKKKTFEHITKIRGQKKKEVIDYFANIKKQARAITDDRQMLHFFKLLKENKYNPALEYEIDKHYVTSYGNFYDILFIDLEGEVFHSVKKEADYHNNIFTSEISNAKLAKKLENPTEDGFVEYEYYPPSGEAAAFFTVLIRDEGKHIGWFVLQCEIDKLNAILQDREGLGRTGEVYLVNREKLMLSESRFMEDSTILQLKVDTVAVKDALRFGEGKKLLNDYRGVNVFSSYEMFDLFGTSWIILVEIDEDEVITDYFKKHQKYFVKQFIEYLGVQNRKPSHFKRRGGVEVERVEMDEFAKIANHSYLLTEGVSTCTAISISYPGKFGYLAHISPTDEIYINNIAIKYFLQKNYHNFLSELIGKIKYFDIYPYELNKLQFVIVATHSESIQKALEIILAQDVGLASIRFMYNPRARSSNVWLESPAYDPHVQWNGKMTVFESAQQTEDLGSIVKKIIQYDA